MEMPETPESPPSPADAEAVRAIEAIVMVAPEPVEPQLLAQLLEMPVATVTSLCQRLAEAYEAAGHELRPRRPASARCGDRGPGVRGQDLPGFLLRSRRPHRLTVRSHSR